MKVMETFNACQGEGQFIGQPSTFIRLFGCNLRCKWCDTAYSINRKEWKASGLKGEPYTELSIEELLDRPLLPHVVITGGEPLLHKELPSLLRRLMRRPYQRQITVETNATVLPPLQELWDTAPPILWSLSPKLTSAEVGDPQLDVILEYARRLNCQLKFVIGSAEDLHQAYLVCRYLEGKAHIAVRIQIILQPEGSVFDKSLHHYLSKLDELQRIVMEAPEWNAHGWNVQVLPQLHVLMHGRTRRFV